MRGRLGFICPEHMWSGHSPMPVGRAAHWAKAKQPCKWSWPKGLVDFPSTSLSIQEHAWPIHSCRKAKASPSFRPLPLTNAKPESIIPGSGVQALRPNPSASFERRAFSTGLVRREGADYLRSRLASLCNRAWEPGRLRGWRVGGQSGLGPPLGPLPAQNPRAMTLREALFIA